jgi:DNA polymerase I-like protein with 3'-5' exonuclease and polymerase domains
MIHGFDNPFDFDMALTVPVFHMMQHGIRIDNEKRLELKHEFQSQWDLYQMHLNSVVGHSLNVNSPTQVKEFIYKDLGLPQRRKGGKITADEDALRSLLAICKDKEASITRASAKIRWTRGVLGITLILKIRGLRKLISSYIDIKFDDDGRMRTTLSIGGTKTFRFSSSKTLWQTGCNLQTIPRKMRVMFIADEGKELCEFDLNRGESWVYSHLADEPTMMAIHQEGRDFHTETACAISEIFGETVRIEDWAEFEEADPERAYKLRYIGKRTNHASAYRMGPYRFAEVVNSDADETGITLTQAQAKRAAEAWLGQYPFITSWWADIERQLGKNSRILRTPYGRVRQFHDRWGDSLFKDATAHVPQSTSVDYLNGGMLRVFNNTGLKEGLGLDLLHQNHDSILVQYDEGKRDEVIPRVIELIESKLLVGKHEITIPVEAQYGQNWYELTAYAPTT